jgi:hypothetical protein
MRPGLAPFAKDLGNGQGNGKIDGRYFQRDEEEHLYLSAKRPDRYRIATGAKSEDDAHRAVLAWLDETLAAERPDLTPTPDRSFADRYAQISKTVQEDFVVLHREPDGADRAIAVYVSFPSGWRPERILGWSFRQIHEPVPDFADDEATSRSLAQAMIERGPYLRFVWTVCADDALDHHPEEGPKTHLGPDTREGFLRIERQVTIPFPEEQASLFLIRTYRRPFETLDARERVILAEALRRMPESTADYKGLTQGIASTIALLQPEPEPG